MADDKPKLSEDWLALWIGLAIFVLSLGTLVGVDLLGWGVKTQVWLQPSTALAPVSAGVAVWGPATGSRTRMFRPEGAKTNQPRATPWVRETTRSRRPERA